MRGAAGAVQAGGAEGGGGGGRSGAGPARNGGQVLPLQRGQGLPGPAPRRCGERHRGERVGPEPPVRMTRVRGERPGHGGQRAAFCDGGGEGPNPRRDLRRKAVRDQPSSSDGTDHSS
ncbi:translation initiation factor IF-2-like [Oenanthe melanoleuca]|uniref:translation initiation factor IF-2-like n=1 Tax=Oenanthe melanoleuca TaxID=2939378 RepID=UPI0024C1902D|nr:translation initiation factor IF-2-like [Oenanthe melanoleuca]